MFDVKKVDAAIEHIAENICSIDIQSYGDVDNVGTMTTALAELIKARARIVESEHYIASSKSIIKREPTHQLVKELLKREGVEHKKVEPYAEGQITANGPAILIKVID